MRCGIIFHETVIHQMTVEFKFLKLSIMIQSPNHSGICKKPRKQNVKLFIRHDNWPINVLKNSERITINIFLVANLSFQSALTVNF